MTLAILLPLVLLKLLPRRVARWPRSITATVGRVRQPAIFTVLLVAGEDHPSVGYDGRPLLGHSCCDELSQLVVDERK